jgi:hypothetical protein
MVELLTGRAILGREKAQTQAVAPWEGGLILS